MKANWKEVIGEFVPSTLRITLYIYLMIMMVGCWHYAVDIWDNRIKPVAGYIRKPVSIPASRVYYLMPHSRASSKSYTH